jgi:hypothetical protein
MAAMIDRPDRGIETGAAAGAGCDRQGGSDGKNERPCRISLDRVALSVSGTSPT